MHGGIRIEVIQGSFDDIDNEHCVLDKYVALVVQVLIWIIIHKYIYNVMSVNVDFHTIHSIADLFSEIYSGSFLPVIRIK